MRIGIDTRSLEEEKGTGVARYLRNLLKNFAEIAPENVYLLYFKTRLVQEDFLEQDCFCKKLVKMPLTPKKKVIWEQVFLPGELALNKVDLLFSPSYLTPFFTPAKSVVTIHDVTYEVNPDWFHPKERLKMRTLTKLAALKASKIIAVSEATKQDIIHYYQVDPAKIRVIYEASEPEFQPIKDEGKILEIKRKYGFQDKLIFYVGSIFTRRNIPQLLEGFRKVANKLQKVQLLIIGEDRAYPPQNINKLSNELGLDDKVIWYEYIPEEDLVLLYNAAELFIYPSSYEGFGLPVLEAMACGTPVITSNRSSLPEVVGDAGLTINPTNIDEIAGAIVRVLTNGELREHLSARSLERAQSFSWRQAAGETLRLFEEVILR